MNKYTFVDLFAGAGGFSEGFLLAGDEESGFDLIAASDIHQNAQLTYENRFRTQLGIDVAFLQQDIRTPSFASKLSILINEKIGASTVDVVIGGPPCQGFSVFGLRDEDDPRNDLFLPYLKTIQTLEPKYFIIENVPGIVKMYEGKTVARIFKEVSKMTPIKYGVTGPIEVNAADFGVPQLRERVIFVGYREDMQPINKVGNVLNSPFVTVKKAIGDLAFLKTWQSNGTYKTEYRARTDYQRESRQGRLFKKLGIQRTDYKLKNHDAAKHSPKVIARFAMIEPGKGLETIPENLWDSHLHTSKKWCVRLHPHKPSFTVVTLPDDLIHYERHRILTVREMARLQSFDDTFEFIGPRASGGGGKGNKKRNIELPQYTQVGNAVPPLLAKGIANTVLRALIEQEK